MTKDKYDIALFERFLELAKTEGTNTIKVVADSEPFTWKVTLTPDEALRIMYGQGLKFAHSEDKDTSKGDSNHAKG